ncbi:MAG TPA: AMP-binding protein [Paludibacter sp.]
MKTIQLNGIIYSNENLDQLLAVAESSNSWQYAIYQFLQNWFDDSDFILSQTSGSTGKPKSIKLPKQSMINSARMTNEFFGLDENKTALLCLPATYIAGKMMLVRALVGGFNLVTVEPSANPFEKLETDIDFVAITPYQLLHSVGSLKNMPIGNIIVGGGHVNSRMEELVADIPASMYETYGMTETASHIALRCFNGENKSDCFTVLDGVDIRLDERGCLAIYAPHLYPNELITTDIVELLGNRSFRWLGRIDSVINSGGVKIFPEQIERKLERIIPSNFFIASLPDDVLENKVVLLIESDKYNALDETKLLEQMRSVLAKYEFPKEIFYLRAFVYSSGNKILKNETLQLLD